jgi:presenilin-like A22 family membrane protease
MSERARIFSGSISMYIVTMALALAAAWRHTMFPAIAGTVAPLELNIQTAAIFLVVFALFTTVIVRFARVARLLLSFFLVVALIVGTQFILAAWIRSPYDIIGAVLIAALVWRLPRVVIHDIGIIFGIGGLATILGLSITPLVAVVLLAALSVYDIISVYRTQHMVTLARRMMSSGAVFGFLVPARFRTFFMRRDDALRERAVMMLGSGDIGLPLVLATSAVSQSVVAALFVAAASLLGVATMQWLFIHQERPAPMAALPPIAAAAIFGYLLAMLLGV